MKKSSAVMGVAAHCDDIEFLFGGTLLKYYEKYDYDIIYVESTNNMSGGWAVRDGKPELPPGDYKRTQKEVFPGRFVWNVPWFIEMPQRKKEAADAAACFGTVPIFLDYPQRHYHDEELNRIELTYGAPLPGCVSPGTPTIVTAHDSSEEVSKVKKLILEKDPEVIITHAPVDYTEEHTATCHLIRKAFDRARKEGYDGSLVFAHPVTSGLYGKFFDLFDTFVDITGFEDKKRFVLGKHACQVPFPEKLDLEDIPRGKRCGVGAAELFFVFELSQSRSGALSDELRKNYRLPVSDR